MLFALGRMQESHQDYCGGGIGNETSTLCLVCEAVLNGSAPRDQESNSWFRQHRDARELSKSSRTGCTLCTAIWLRFIHHEASEGKNFLSLKLADENVFCKFDVFANGRLMLPIRTCKRVIRLGPMRLDQVNIDTRLSSRTNSDASFSLAARWLKECSRNHVKCKANESSWLPTRLIDVQLGTDQVKLVITGQLKERPLQYATLSHCWGKKHFLVLTEKSTKTMTQGIPICNLSKTFQEAIIIARRLEFKYIWIDSLCIIQDSETDWSQELTKMEDVYLGSGCNIAATGSSDGDGGCFRDRSALHANPCIIKITGTAKYVASRLHGKRSPDGIYVVNTSTDVWDANIFRSPLLSRAWVLQERLLAPRLLHFGSEQLIWECNETAACESYPNGFPNLKDTSKTTDFEYKQRYSGVATPLNRESGRIDSSKQSISSPKSDAIKIWAKIRKRYMETSLTYAKDKLPALSGVAKNMQRKRGGEGYFAGMWRDGFEEQLLWMADPMSLHSKPTTYRCPSWSWLAIEGPLREFTQVEGSGSKFIHCKVEKIHVELVDANDPCGAVTGGQLRIKGFLKSADFSQILPSDEGMTFILDTIIDDSATSTKSAIYYCLDEPWRPTNASAIFFFHIIHMDYSDSKSWGFPVDHGLLLQSAGRKDEYTRIGTFFTTDEYYECSRFWRRQPRRKCTPSVLEEGAKH